MELPDLMIRVENMVRAAKNDFDCAADGACRDHLGYLYDLLDDVVGSKAREKCDSAESSNGQQ